MFRHFQPVGVVKFTAMPPLRRDIDAMMRERAYNSFGDATITTYMEVKKADGSKRFYKVKDETTTEIGLNEYLANVK